MSEQSTVLAHPIERAADELRARGFSPVIQHTGGGIAAVAVMLDDGTAATVWLDPLADPADDAPSYAVTRHADMSAFWACQTECPTSDALPLRSLAEAVAEVAVCDAGAPLPVTGEKIARVVDAAVFAFWQSVALAFPDVETGDLDPLACARFDETAASIITLWLATNGAPVADDAR